MIQKRFISLAAAFVVLSGCAPRVDQKDFETLYRSGKAISGATGVGVNYSKFSDLVQAFASEVSIGADRADNKPEKSMIGSYEKALEAYRHSLTVWKHSIDSARYDFIPSGEIFVEEELIPIISEYGLQTQPRQIAVSGTRFETIKPSSIQEIWVKADKYLTKANAEYSGANKP